MEQLKIPYLTSHGGKSLLWHVYDLLLAYFLVRHLQLGPQTAGAVAMSLMMVGAFADPVAAVLLARRVRSVAWIAQLQTIAGGASACLLLLLFTVEHSSWSVVQVVVIGLLFQLAYKGFDIPSNAMTSLLARDSGEVMDISSWRYFLSATARIVVSIGMAAVISVGGMAPARSLMPFVMAICVCMLLSLWWFARVARTAGSTTFAASSQVARGDPIRRHMLPSLLGLMLAALANAGVMSAMARLLPFLDAQPAMLACFSIGALLLLPVCAFWGRRFGEHMGLLAAVGLTAAAATLFVVCHAVTGIPAYWKGICALLYGGGLFGSTMLLWGAVANLVHRHGGRSGGRADALAYGLFTFASKLGIAGSFLLLGGHLLSDGSGQVPAVADFARSAMLVVTGSLACAVFAYPVLRSLACTMAPSIRLYAR